MLDAKGKLIPGANTISNYGAHLGTSIARSVANAGVRSLIDGSDFGDNIAAALPDVIGQTLGSIMAMGVANADEGDSQPINLLPDNFWDANVPDTNAGAGGSLAMTGSGFQLPRKFGGNGSKLTDLLEGTYNATSTGVQIKTPSGLPFEQLAVSDRQDLYGTQSRLLAEYTDPRDQAWINSAVAAWEAANPVQNRADPVAVTEETSFFDEMISNLVDTPIAAFGGVSLSEKFAQYQINGDSFSQSLQSGADWLLRANEANARGQIAGQRAATIFTANAGHAILSGFAQMNLPSG